MKHIETQYEQEEFECSLKHIKSEQENDNEFLFI